MCNEILGRSQSSAEMKHHVNIICFHCSMKLHAGVSSLHLSCERTHRRKNLIRILKGVMRGNRQYFFCNLNSQTSENWMHF